MVRMLLFRHLALVSLATFGMAHPICELCSCDKSHVPYFVDCSHDNLDVLLTHWDTQAFTSSGDNSSSDDNSHYMLDVDFSDNSLERVAQLPALPVRSLSFRANKISRVDDRAFKNLRFFGTLDLSRNELEGGHLARETFEGTFNATDYEPLSLLELDLSHNRIQSLDRTTFDHLTQLQVLRLDANPLNELDAQTTAAITSLARLRTLSLDRTGLKTLPENFMPGFKNLEVVSLASNLFYQVPKDLKSIATLKDLDLSNNSIVILDAESFQGLGSLERLSLNSQLLLRRIERAAFTPLARLSRLHVQNCSNLHFLHPDAFERLDTESFALRTLDLRANNLTYLPEQLLPDLANWRQLELLDLRDNPWQCDCHNQWMLVTLVKIIEEEQEQEELAGKHLKCAGPGNELKGKSMAGLVIHPSRLPCDPLDNFNPYRETFGLGHSRRSGRQYGHDPGQLALSVGIVCVLTVLASAVFVGGLYVQKQRRLRYRTLHNVHFNQAMGSASSYRDADAEGIAADADAVADTDGRHTNILRREQQ